MTHPPGHMHRSKLAVLKEYDAELRSEGFLQVGQADQDCIFLRAVVLHLLDANHDGQVRQAQAY